MRLDVGAKYGIHAGKMAFALFLKPLEYVAVDAKVHRSLAWRHHDPGTFPEIIAQSRGLRRVGSGPTCSAGDFSFNRLEGISHGSTFSRHAGLLSSR